MNDPKDKRKENRILQFERTFSLTPKLWCGKTQGLCDGSLCTMCHLFPSTQRPHLRTVESGSILASSSMTDHKRIGLTALDEEE